MKMFHCSAIRIHYGASTSIESKIMLEITSNQSSREKEDEREQQQEFLEAQHEMR